MWHWSCVFLFVLLYKVQCRIEQNNGQWPSEYSTVCSSALDSLRPEINGIRNTFLDANHDCPFENNYQGDCNEGIATFEDECESTTTGSSICVFEYTAVDELDGLDVAITTYECVPHKCGEADLAVSAEKFIYRLENRLPVDDEDVSGLINDVYQCQSMFLTVSCDYELEIVAGGFPDWLIALIVILILLCCCCLCILLFLLYRRKRDEDEKEPSDSREKTFHSVGDTRPRRDSEDRTTQSSSSTYASESSTNYSTDDDSHADRANGGPAEDRYSESRYSGDSSDSESATSESASETPGDDSRDVSGDESEASEPAGARAYSGAGKRDSNASESTEASGDSSGLGGADDDSSVGGGGGGGAGGGSSGGSSVDERSRISMSTESSETESDASSDA